MAPAQHAAGSDPQNPLTQIGIVAIGVVVGWLIILIAAQAAPETFYVPVKFVVEELPRSLQ